MSKSAIVSREAEDVYTIGAPGPCSQLLVESELLIYFSYFVSVVSISLCSLLCLSVGSLDYSFSI